MRNIWASKLYKYYDEHPDASPKSAAIAVGCSAGTASSAKNRWKKMRGYFVGTREYPIRALTKVNSVEQKDEMRSIPAETLSASEIAAELLHKSLEAIRDYNKIIAEKNFWRKQAVESEEARKKKKAVEERDRILKIHNEMVKQINSENLPSMDEILSALRRDMMKKAEIKF